ncbi:integrase catalytic domain-containing protein [Blastococcus saxobsidens]|uniref:Integrase, catalytic region n=1 Tax=Blastococcus saxobsidens (strain DD2) TaxID=1146883 RepID=H6RN45_BLASD|nr:DDE-type integrase/transposase/recombinase [Blastococcus saxobsidens]CCG01398.1 Integrase, catalytic region [Blastococcus saxobsidens DD2]
MGQRKAVTKTTAKRYRSASKSEKAAILTELCAVTGWHRDHARKALRLALAGEPPRRARAPRPPVYGEDVLVPLRKIWAVLDAPAGKRLAPFLPEITTALERAGELDLTPAVRAQLVGMSAATIDRRLAGDRKKLQLKGRSGTKPGSLLKSQIPIRTWADWNEDEPGFVEIDLVGHEGGDPSGDFAQTLTVTDIATGWTETRAVRNKAQKWVFAALMEITAAFPFPVKGIDSDNGSEFINAQLLRYCVANKITFTRSRAGRKNDGAHVEQKNWSVVRQAVGYHRFDTGAEVDALNELYARLRLQINFFSPQQKLIEKTRDGAKVIKRYDTVATPHQRTVADDRIPAKIRTALDKQYRGLNPAQLRRDQHALSDKLLDLVRTKHLSRRVPATPPATRAPAGEATKAHPRASARESTKGRTRAS